MKSAATAQSSQTRAPGLRDVPETMLMTLHSRATEAMRSDTPFADPEAVRIYRSIDYDFRRNFGPPEPSMALRASVFDQALREFLEVYPSGQIVNLGEGLETQRFRVEAPGSQWFTVDLPESIEIRERFISPDARHVHIPCSATDAQWLDFIDGERPTFVAAQGLLMYLRESEVRQLMERLGQHFQTAHLVFDVIPRWVSRATVIGGGLPRTPFYKTPPMPWGVRRHQLSSTLRRWVNRPVDVRQRAYPAWPRGPARAASKLVSRLPGFQHVAPGVVEVRMYG